MGLCGGRRCGCIIVGKQPAAALALSGEYPVLGMRGSGEPGDPASPYFNTGWADEFNEVIAESAAAALAWTDFTPVWTQSTNITFTKHYSKYTRTGAYGKTIIWNFALTSTNNGGGTAPVTLSVPVNGFNNLQPAGICGIYSASTTTRLICAARFYDDATQLSFWSDVNPGQFQVGFTPNTGLVAGSSLRGSILYEAL